jgi:hypothetical protein
MTHQIVGPATATADGDGNCGDDVHVGLPGGESVTAGPEPTEPTEPALTVETIVHEVPASDVTENATVERPPFVT